MGIWLSRLTGGYTVAAQPSICTKFTLLLHSYTTLFFINTESFLISYPYLLRSYYTKEAYGFCVRTFK